MDRTQYEQMLKSAFATEFAFYLKAANFHWNVEGSDFYEFHLIFERIYTEVYDSIDDFAEELRSTRIYTPASLAVLDALSMVKGQDNMPLAAPSMAASVLWQRSAWSARRGGLPRRPRPLRR